MLAEAVELLYVIARGQDFLRSKEKQFLTGTDLEDGREESFNSSESVTVNFPWQCTNRFDVITRRVDTIRINEAKVISGSAL